MSGSFCRRCWSALGVLLVILPAGCGDADPASPEEVPYTGQASRVEPPPNTTLVDPGTVIFLYYDGKVLPSQLEATIFLINGEEVQGVGLSGDDDFTEVELTPVTPLVFHEYYTVEVVPDGEEGLREYSWQFATGPGGLGELWELVQTPVAEDLLSLCYCPFPVSWLALGKDGTLVNAGAELAWQELAGGVGSGGNILDWGLGPIYYSRTNSNYFILASYGQYALFDRFPSAYMSVWDFPDGVLVQGMSEERGVVVGYWLADPDVGLIFDGFALDTIFETGSGRVMRAAAKGFDGQDFYLAVGDEASVYLSRDGLDWEEVHHAAVLGSLQDLVVVWDPLAGVDPLELVVAVGDALLYSTDGRYWIGIISNEFSVLNGVAASQKEGWLVAVGDAGVILTSNDGLSWTTMTELTLDFDLNDVQIARDNATGRSQCVIVGDGGRIVLSPPQPLAFAEND